MMLVVVVGDDENPLVEGLSCEEQRGLRNPYRCAGCAYPMVSFTFFVKDVYVLVCVMGRIMCLRPLF